MNNNWLITAALTCCLLPREIQAQALDFPTFRQMVLDQHPIARQADLYGSQAKASLLRAKGGFDPKAFASHNGKNFNGKTYFQYSEAGLSVPTWAGLEIKTAYRLASGIFLNSESKLPQDGQANLGFVWSLGQGLLFDERRAGLQWAQYGLEMGEAERLMLRNDLMLEAAKAYWNWNYSDNALQIIDAARRQAEIRHEGMRQSFQQGERSAFDTLATFIQVQNRLVDWQFAQVDARNASLELCRFLWENNQAKSPENLPVAPSLAISDAGLSLPFDTANLLQTALQRHPEMRQYQIKLRQLDVERRLKNEKRKPVLDVSYYLLGNAWQFFPTASINGPEMLANDIKWGLDFSYPLFNRKARGDWQLTRLKQAQTDLELTQKRQSIRAKVQQYANDLANYSTQATLFRDMAANYQRLLEGENDKFAAGESSIFLINTREQRWLDAQLKYLKLLAELRKTEAALFWAAGIVEE